MRPYRAIPIGGKDFVYGWYAKFGDNCIILDGSGWKAYPDEINTLKSWKVIPESVAQQIGLKDKNNNKVWNKSILAKPKDKERWNAGEAERIIVEYNERLTRFLCSFWTIYGGEGYSGNTEGQQLCDYIKDGWIVIGNAHQNPELLEDKLIGEKE